MTEETPQDASNVVEGKGGYEYLVRSVAIVTLLYERGILQELIESGRLDEEEIEQRIAIIRDKYKIAMQADAENDFGGR